MLLITGLTVLSFRCEKYGQRGRRSHSMDQFLADLSGKKIMFLYLTVCLYLSVCICLSVYIFLSIDLSIYRSIYLSVCLSIYLSLFTLTKG